MSYGPTHPRVVSRYAPQAGFWDWITGGSGESGTVADKTPGKTVDFTKLYMIQRQELMKRFSWYPTRFANNIQQPKINLLQGTQILLFWSTLAKITADDARKAGRSATLLDAAYNRFQTSGGQWSFRATTAGNSYESKYIQPEYANELFDNISRLCIELTNGVWVGFNIESAWDRAKWAVKDSTPAAIMAVFDATISTFKIGAEITKWVILGTIAFTGLWLVSKLTPRQSGGEP